MRFIFTVLIAFNFLIGFSQSQFDCDKLLATEINLDYSDSNNLNIFYSNFNNLSGCGLDDVDIIIFSNGPLLGTLLVGLANKNKQDTILTYQVLLDFVNEFKSTEGYKDIRNQTLAFIELRDKPADIANWETDKLILKKHQFNEEFIQQYHQFLVENSNPEITHQELILSFGQQKDEINSKYDRKESVNNSYLDTVTIYKYHELLDIAKEANKPLLLFFTGMACVNARNMEINILNQIRVDEIIRSNFLFINLPVDDRTMLPSSDSFISEFNGRAIKTIGNNNTYIQLKYFESNHQPYFVIVSPNGDVLAIQEYTESESVFLEFLSLGLIHKK